MSLRKTAAVTTLCSLSVMLVTCGTAIQVRKDTIPRIKKTAIVSMYCPAMITVNNPRQLEVFHLVDMAKESKLKRDEMIAAFRPRGLFLLGIAQEELAARLSTALGWEIKPLSAVVKKASYGPLKQWNSSAGSGEFSLMMSAEGGAFLWLNEKDGALRDALVKLCEAEGLDAVIIASFDFAYTKGPWRAEGTFPAAKANTFTGLQVVNREGLTVIDMPRADRRDRDFADFSDEAMQIKGWAADINEKTINYYKSSIRKSVARVVGRIR